MIIPNQKTTSSSTERTSCFVSIMHICRGSNFAAQCNCRGVRSGACSAGMNLPDGVAGQATYLVAALCSMCSFLLASFCTCRLPTRRDALPATLVGRMTLVTLFMMCVWAAGGRMAGMTYMAQRCCSLRQSSECEFLFSLLLPLTRLWC